MSDIEIIEAARRENLGKGNARADRRAGNVPGVVYGEKKDPIAISINFRTMNRLINQPGFFATLFSLDVAGDKMNVLARDLQLHPVSDVPMHVDFLRVAADAKIAVEVQVNFINEDKSQGLLDGGILNVVRYAIEVFCRPDAIPEQIDVDMTGFEVGDSVHISSVTLPDGVEPTITDRDFTIATIAAVVTEAAAAESEETEGEGEGEDGEEASESEDK